MTTDKNGHQNDRGDLVRFVPEEPSLAPGRYTLVTSGGEHATVALAILNEGTYAYRVNQERRKREAYFER